MDHVGHDVDLEGVLADLNYPADKWQIIACVEVYGVDLLTRRELYDLPVRPYGSAQDVKAALDRGIEAGKPGYPYG